MQNITLCSDDFALNTAVSEGILDLAKIKRINAISCLTNLPLWPEYAKKLKPLHSPTLNIGLHLNLTEGQQSYSLKTLIQKSILRTLPAHEIYQTLQTQLQRFRQHFGNDPDFLDGHQHIHILPVVREAILQLYQYHFPLHQPFCRAINPPLNTLKAWILRGLGSAQFNRLLECHNIPHNTVFSGLYSFQTTTQKAYQSYFEKFLSHMKPHGLIMCHPARENHDLTADPIAKQRFIEYQFFKSAAYESSIRRFALTNNSSL